MEPTVHGLLRKRKELAQRVDALRYDLARASADLDAIDRALSVFGHGEPLPTPVAYSVMFDRNELTRLVLRMLRELSPQTTRDLTIAIVQAKGRDPDDRMLYDKVNKTVGRRLRELRNRGVLSADDEAGAYVWRLAL